MTTTGALYTTQLQAGLGMIPETLGLLRLWEPGMNSAHLAARAIDEGLFSRATARRARNLAMEMFAPRYLGSQGEAAIRLKSLLEYRVPQETILQLCFLYTARAQRIFRDFVVDVYWPKYSAGATILSRNDALEFVQRALDSGLMATRWSESTVKRVSGYLLGCCADFGLVASSGRFERGIQRFSIRPDIALYLAYDLHLSGVSDSALIRHPDWLLFGFAPGEILTRLKNLAHDGHFMIQSSGELVQISWKYRTMNECLHALAQR